MGRGRGALAALAVAWSTPAVPGSTKIVGGLDLTTPAGLREAVDRTREDLQAAPDVTVAGRVSFAGLYTTGDWGQATVIAFYALPASATGDARDLVAPTPPSRVVAQRRLRRAWRDVEVDWAEPDACPAIVRRLRRLQAVHEGFGGMPGAPRPETGMQVDGESALVWGPTAHVAPFASRRLVISGDEGSPAYAWAYRTREALEPCWRPAPPAGLGAADASAAAAPPPPASPPSR